MKKVLLGLAVLVVLVAIISGVSGKKSQGSSGRRASADAAAAASSDSEKSNIALVASKSFCVATGIDDAYTGNGHVEFFLTFRNKGAAAGSVSAIPVRHYDDGGTNMSAMDEVTADVAAGASAKFHTPMFEYKAHEHEIESCGVLVDGGEEIPIAHVSP